MPVSLPSEKGYAFIAAREACVLTMYPDSHNPAIGFGQNDPTLKSGDTITMAQAIDLLVREGTQIAKGLAKAFTDVKLPQNQVDALVCLGYNLGVTGIIRDNPKLVTAVRAYAKEPGNHTLRDLAGMEFITAHPKDGPVPFNFSRRCREALVFTAGDYGDLSTLMVWGTGKDPKHDKPEFIPMPKFGGSV